MRFDPNLYGEPVARILALDGTGDRLMPLAGGRCSSGQARAILGRSTARELFPGARASEAALSGLWLYFSCLDESHSLSQRIDTPEGSFWHGIMHRQEPDAGNAAYWFRRVGDHPVFEPLAAAAAAAGYSGGARWDPFAFIEVCEAARTKPGSPGEHLALQVQRAEWQLLFDYCARPHPALSE